MAMLKLGLATGLAGIIMQPQGRSALAVVEHGARLPRLVEDFDLGVMDRAFSGIGADDFLGPAGDVHVGRPARTAGLPTLSVLRSLLKSLPARAGEIVRLHRASTANILCETSSSCDVALVATRAGVIHALTLEG